MKKRPVAKISVILFLFAVAMAPVFITAIEEMDGGGFAEFGAITEFLDDDFYALDTNALAAEEEAPEYFTAMLAVIIDDFGQSRFGVDEIIAVDRPLTLAVMPFLEHTAEDAERGYAAGHEIILHMPMEAKAGLGVLKSWLGPKPLMSWYSDDEICQIYNESLDNIPHASGANIHIGSLVSENEHIMTLIMAETAKRGLYFVDSRTAAKSACRIAASNIGLPFAERDVFLERAGEKSVSYAKSQLAKAGEIAKSTGAAIAIGHVGMEGGAETARAIVEMIPVLEAQGVEFVPVSRLVKQ